MLSGEYFYNQTIKKAVSVFGTIFNNISIRKYNSVEERVPISYGPRQKFLSRIESDRTEEAVAIKVPRMSFLITDIAYDTNSSLNKNNKIISSSTSTSKNSVNQSVPYTISMELSILSKSQDEALQILEQIIPTFSPEYTVAITDMNAPGSSTDVPVILNSISLQDDFEGDFETRRTIVYTLSFTMKVRFYGSVFTNPVIRTVTADVYDTTNNVIDDSPFDPSDRVDVRVGENDTPDNFTATTTFGFDNDDDDISSPQPSVNNETFEIDVTFDNGFNLDGTDRNGAVDGINQNININLGDTIIFRVDSVQNPFWLKTVKSAGQLNTNIPGNFQPGGIATINNGAIYDPRFMGSRGPITFRPISAGTYYYNHQFDANVNGDIIVT